MKLWQKKNEIQRMKLIKLITARPERTMVGEGILSMEFIYNNDFLLIYLLKVGQYILQISGLNVYFLIN